MKIAAVFVILLVVLLPAMGVSMTGDGTVKGRLQTFVSYGLSLTSLLLCLLTIVVSIYSLTSDIKQKQIYTVVTKPIRRFQLLLGKLLGVVLLDAALLALFSAMIYGVTIYIPKYLGADKAELTRLGNEFFTARAGLVPTEVDVSKEVLDTYKKLEKSGQLDQIFRGASRKRILAELTRQKQLEKRAAAVGQNLLWEFDNVHLVGPDLGPKDQSLFIRFKYDVSVPPPDLHVYSKWNVGDYRQIRYGTKIQTPIYTSDGRKDPIRTFREIEVPADAVAADGYLAVEFINLPLNNTVVIFPLEGGLEVLYKADTFGANFIRAVLVIGLRLIFLACLGTLASTFLSFPVAILLCLAVFFTASVSGFVIDSFNYISAELSGVYSYAIKPLIALLPQFDKLNPAKFLVPARLLSWTLLARIAGIMICIKAVLLLLLALLIFSYREIARVII
jgi:hypothetical protein